MTKQEFQELVKRGTVLLDGATGSNLMQAGMPRGVCTEQWVCENPQPLMELQKGLQGGWFPDRLCPYFFCKQDQSGESRSQDKVEGIK